MVLVAVNRGEPRTIAIQNGIHLPPGRYKGLLHTASPANRDSVLIVSTGKPRQTTLHLGRLGSLVVSSSHVRGNEDEEQGNDTENGR